MSPAASSPPVTHPPGRPGVHVVLGAPGTGKSTRVVEEVVGPLPAHLSEGQALAALVQVAREHLRERSLDSSYAEYASHETGDDLEHVRSNRARREQRERRRSLDEGIPIDSRYLATVRRATVMPPSSSRVTRRLSESGLPGGSS